MDIVQVSLKVLDFFLQNFLKSLVSGGTSSFTVNLNSSPTGIVTIPIGSSDTDKAVSNTSMLQFTAANWNIPQTVAMIGRDIYVTVTNFFQKKKRRK